MATPFAVHGVVHLVRPSGLEAVDLAGLRAGIEAASDASLFYHVHHPRLRHPFATSAPPDDFSAWANGVVQDREAAERIAYAAQSGGPSAGALREALLAALARGLGRGGAAGPAPPESAFVFREMDSVAVDLERSASDCDGLVELLCGGSPAIFFHHVIERPWFAAGESAAAWALAQGEAALAEWIEASAHDGRPLAESQLRLGRRWRRSRVVRRVADGIDAPEGVRQAGARRLVRRLVRRMHED